MTDLIFKIKDLLHYKKKSIATRKYISTFTFVQIQVHILWQEFCKYFNIQIRCQFVL